MQLTMKQRGIITLIGGFFLMLVTGSVFLWGQMNVQKEDSDLKLSIGGAIFPVMMASLATGIPLGIKGIKLFGSARISCIISSIISSSMVFISSYTERFWQFVIVYGVINGIALGSIYFVPIYMGYLYFPQNKGLVAGITTGGFALCSFVFGLIFFNIVNPDGLTQIKNDDGYQYFESTSIEVARNVPNALRSVSYMYLGVSIASAMLLMYHPNQIGEEEKRLQMQLKVKQAEEKIVEENIQKINKSIQQEQIGNQQGGENKNDHSIDANQKGLTILNHTLQLVKLEEQVIQKKISIVQHQEEQASYEVAFPNIQETQKKYDTTKEGVIKSQQTSYTESDQVIIEQNQIIKDIIGSDPFSNKVAHNNSIINNIEDQIQNLNENQIKNLNDDQIQQINKDLNNKEVQIQQELQLAKKKDEEIQAINKLGAPSIIMAFKQPQLYMSILLGILSIGIGVLVNGNYKIIAKDFGYTDDSYQTLVGSLGGIANGFSRPLWSTLLDKFTFKQIIIVIHIIEIIFTLTFQFSDSSKTFFIIWVFVIHMTFGAVLGMWPVLSAQLNGVKVGSQLFGLYWYGFSIANLLQFFLVYALKTEIGFINLFYIYAAQSFIALILVLSYSFKVDWYKHYIQYQLDEKQKKQQQKYVEQEQLQIKIAD